MSVPAGSVSAATTMKPGAAGCEAGQRCTRMYLRRCGELRRRGSHEVGSQGVPPSAAVRCAETELAPYCPVLHSLQRTILQYY